jgi:hypothetical protein
VAPRTVAPRTVAPRTVAPRTVAPGTVAPGTVAPGEVSCYESTKEGCVVRQYSTIQECWDRKGFPAHEGALTEQEARRQCNRLQPLSGVSWHGAPSESGTFLTKAVCLGRGCADSNIFKSSYLSGCKNDETRQSSGCLQSQQRWEKKRRKGCIAPTVTQFVPQYDSQTEVLKAPICVGTTTWDYEKKEGHANGITFAACFAKDRCEKCPCDQGECYDPKEGCVPKAGVSCPVGSRPMEKCYGGGKTQADCQGFGTQLLCPSAEECMSGEYALRSQQVAVTE